MIEIGVQQLKINQNFNENINRKNFQDIGICISCTL